MNKEWSEKNMKIQEVLGTNLDEGLNILEENR